MGGEGQSGGLHGVEDLSPEYQGEISLGNQDDTKNFVETGNIHGGNNE